MRLGHARRPLLSTIGSLLILTGLLPAAAAIPVLAVSPDVVISEVYGGGGNSGATFTNDYIELYNRGAAAVDLTGWSVQYGSSGGTTWTNRTNLSGSIAAGKYFLIQEGAGAGGTTPLPMPNVTGTILMSATAGKVALVNSTTALTGTGCPFAASVVDFVGYGTAANCFETAPTATLTNTTAAIRAGGGTIETDNNAADFAVGPPDPDTSADAAPSVSTTTPPAGASGVDASTNVGITFSEPVTVSGAWYTITCTLTGAHAATVSGGPTTFTLDPTVDFGSSESCTVSVLATQVTDQDDIDPPNEMAANFLATFSMVDACTLAFTPIPAIQGSGPSAAITGSVATQGVVIADHEYAGAVPAPATLRGFYIQDPTGDADASTSDGIFVFNANRNDVSLGDLVRVAGTAAEFRDQTQITASSINDCGDGSVTATDVELPFADAARPERYEGMLVRLPQTLVVNEHFQLGRFGQVLVGSTRHFSPTLVAEPGPAALAELAAQRLDSLLIDDDSQSQNPDPIVFGRLGNPLSASNTLRIGDSIADVVGVMTYTWGGNAASPNAYRVRPLTALGGGIPSFQATNQRPANIAPIAGDLRVAAMNVLNYFTTIDQGPDVCGPTGGLDCRGADSQLEFNRQQAKIVSAIVGLDADIVTLNELENNSTASLDSLVAGLDTVDGSGTWAAIHTGTIGTDAIKIGMIYKPAAVTPVGPHAVLTSAVDPRFIDTRSRPALAQTFDQIGGGRLTVVGNHLKSKGSGCGAGDDATDGSGNCNGTRTQAAEALVDWIASDPTASGDRDVLVIGDLNSYAREEPIDVFIREGYTNLVETYLGADAYSFVFDGSAGYLDHALASPTLAAQVAGATEWHINADEPGVLDYNTEFKSATQVGDLYAPDQFRSADHDPLVVGLNLLDFEFQGFQPPVHNPPAVNGLKAGGAVPIKFELVGDLGLNVLFGTPFSATASCPNWLVTGGAAATETAGSAGLQYDPVTNTYTWAWKTTKSWAHSCRVFEITFDDGTYRTARFNFTK